MSDLPPPVFDETELLELPPTAARELADGLQYGVRFRLRAEITPVQRAFLDRTGFLVFDRVASVEEVETILAEVEQVEASLIAEETRTLFGVPIWFGRDPDGKRWLQRMGFTSVLSDYLSGFVKHSRFEPVRRLIGEEARIGEREKDGVVFNRYVNAEGSLRPNLAWHTDALRDVFYNRRMPGPMLNVGLHFDRITPQDGCLVLLPGTHTQSTWSTLFRKVHFVTDKPDPKEVKVETWPGDLTVHDGRMWHRVQTSPHTGWRSLRRSMYVPYVVDAYAPKDEHTKTNLYMRLFDWIVRRKTRRMEKRLLAG